jgi:hypothetical protein
VSSLSAFFLLSIVPMVPILAFLSFLQRQQSQVERIMGAVYMVFVVRAWWERGNGRCRPRVFGCQLECASSIKDNQPR